MNLTYRGVRYDSQSASVEPQAVSATDLKYRGARYRRHQVAQAEALDAILTYRGVAYATAPAVKSAMTPSIQEQARLKVINQQRREKQRQLSMLSRSTAEVGAH
jgi:hypothetical protein